MTINGVDEKVTTITPELSTIDVLRLIEGRTPITKKGIPKAEDRHEWLTVTHLEKGKK